MAIDYFCKLSIDGNSFWHLFCCEVNVISRELYTPQELVFHSVANLKSAALPLESRKMAFLLKKTLFGA